MWHILAGMCIPVVINVAVVRASRPRRPRVRHVDHRRHLLVAIAACSAVAGVIHLAVCPDHFEEAAAFGVFFVLAAALQLAWAGLVFTRPSKAVLLAGAAGNITVLALWLLTRTAGLPIGPNPWHSEAVGALDGLSGVLEALVIAGAAILVRSGQRPSFRSLSR